MNIRRTQYLLWITTVLLGAAGLALPVCGWCWPCSVEAVAPPSAVRPGQSKPKGERIALVSAKELKSLAKIQLHRPLYDPPPPPPPKPPPPPPKPKPGFRVIGIVVESGHSMAMVTTNRNEILFLRTGQTIPDEPVETRIERIEDDAVVVQFGDETLTRQLEETKP